MIALTAIWKRPEITRICFEGLKKLPLDKVICVVSEQWAKDLCDEYGFIWVEEENLPLGNKWNAGIKEVMKHDFDYLLQLGSDNLISPQIFDYYSELMEKGIDFFGTKQIYFLEGDKAKLHTNGECYGAARVFSKKMLDVVTKWVEAECLTSNSGTYGAFTVGERVLMPKKYLSVHFRKLKEITMLWPSDINSCLDWNSEIHINLQGYPIHEVVMDVPHVLDIKSEVNVHGYKKVGGEKVSVREATWFLDHEQKDMLWAYTQEHSTEV